MKKLICLLLSSLLILACFCGCGSKSAEAAASAAEVVLPEWTENLSDAGKAAVSEIVAKGKLVMGTSADYAPFEFHTKLDGADTIVGYDVSWGQYLADSFGVELEIVDMSFDNLLISVGKGDFDVVLASMSETPERAQAADFSVPYHGGDAVKKVIVIRSESLDNYPDLASFAGVKVAAQSGSTLVPAANEIAGEENVILLTKLQDAISELKAGKIEAVFCDGDVGFGYEENNDDLICLDYNIPVEEEGASVVMKKGSDGLKEAIDYLIGLINSEQKDTWMNEAQILAGNIEE